MSVVVTGTASMTVAIPQNGVFPSVNTNGSIINAAVSGASVQPFTLATGNTMYSITPPAWAVAVTIIPDGTHDIWLGGTVGAGWSAAATNVCAGTQPFIGPIPIKPGSPLIIGSPNANIPITLIWS